MQVYRVRNTFKNTFQQEEEAEPAAAEGEDQCHRIAYNRRLRATQSPNYHYKPLRQ